MSNLTRRGFLILALLFVSPACESYSRPGTLLPELHLTRTDGSVIGRRAFEGKPWVIHLWLPG